MQRWSWLVFGLLFIGATIAIVLRVRVPEVPPSTASAEPHPSSVGSSEPAPVPAGDDAGSSLDSGPDRDRFSTFPDGGSVPSLPKDAPSSVKFGAILFAYEGAEFAGADARSKAEALEKAQAAIPQAKKDFGEAVKLGDPGSTAEAGRLPRGVLEPSVEYVLFTMDRGEVHDQPLDTPRGFWVVRRNQ
jgi:hypothetical protein